MLGWKDPLKKKMETRSSILAWRIPWTEKSLGYSPCGCKERKPGARISPSVSLGTDLNQTLVLEPIKQSEVSQMEKTNILTNIYKESRKTVLMNLFSGQQWKRRHREQTCGHIGEGESGMN